MLITERILFQLGICMLYHSLLRELKWARKASLGRTEQQVKEGIFGNTRVRKVSVYAMLRNDKAKGGIIEIKPTKKKKEKGMHACHATVLK